MAKVLHGDANGNQLNASENKTQIYGLKGNDTLISDNKSDVLLVGGSGDDSLIILGGAGTLSGGEGSDVFELNYSADKKLSAVIEDLNPSEDKIIVKFDGSTTPELTSSVSGNDVVWKDSDGNFNVTLKSVRDNDYFDGTASNDTWDAWEAWKVLELVNQAREDDGKSPLTMSQGLMRGASIRAQEITSLGQDGALSNHTRPNGTNFSTVLNNRYSNPRENLDGGARTPNEVMYDWLVKSETHRKNILTSSFQKMGLGYVYNDQDQTNHRWYWAQMFADSLRSPETVSTARLSSVNFEIKSSSKFIQLTDNTIENSVYSATIQGTDSADSIDNTGLNVSISGGADNDTILSGGSFSTIAGNTDNDLISLGSDTKENVIEYSSGDGNDSIQGFHSTDTLKILDDEYTPAIVSGNVVVGVGSDSITLLGAADLSSVNIEGTRSKHYIFTNANDKINNTLDGATIEALGGKDLITNSGANVSLLGGTGSDSITNDSSGTGSTLDGGAGDDTLNNAAETVTVTGNAGNDFISNNGSQVSVNGGAGDDTINNSAETVTVIGGKSSDNISNSGVEVSVFGGDGSDKITNDSLGTSSTLDGGEGADSINNAAETVTVIGGEGSDNISNSGVEVSLLGGEGSDKITNDSLGTSSTLDGGTGDDTIDNDSANVSINGGGDNDYINNDGTNSTLEGGTGNDSILNYAANVSINAGTGNDNINNYYASNVSIYGGAGDDTINLSGITENILIQYKSGDGFDIIEGFEKNSTLSISGGEYTRATVGNDIVFVVGEGEIRLVDAAELDEPINIIGTGSESEEYRGYVELTEDNATYHNDVNHASIVATGNNVSINNSGNNVSILGGDGSDKITNDSLGTSSTLDGGTGDDTIDNDSANVSILGGAGNDSITNSSYGWDVSIDSGDGNDSITNSGFEATINAGDGDDTIQNDGSNVTIDAGAGDDQINLASDSENNLIVYNVGDGNDFIQGFNDDDTLEIRDVTSNYSTQTSGNDIIVNVEDEKITLQGAASLESVNIFINWSEIEDFILTEGNDVYFNDCDDVTIEALGGNDSRVCWQNRTNKKT